MSDHILSRVEPSISYRAPSNEAGTCKFCGIQLREGDIIVDVNESESSHVDCYLDAANPEGE